MPAAVSLSSQTGSSVELHKQSCLLSQSNMRRHLTQLLFLSSAVLLANPQPPCHGVVSFEKISRSEPNAESVLPDGVLLDEPGHAVTIDCLATCYRQAACFGTSVDYSSSRCSSFSSPPDAAADFLPSANHFFQKVCYRNISLPSCGPVTGRRIWTIDRILGARLDGFVSREFTTKHSLGCSKQCLLEKSFNCSSASYERVSGRCLLSKETRRTQPQAFRDAYLNGTWMYMENQCVQPGTVCDYDRRQNKAAQTVDLLSFADDVRHCEDLCRKESRFLCRSYSFANSRCSMSADDRTSSSVALPAAPGATYGELVCASDDCVHGHYFFEKVIGHALESAEEQVMQASVLDCELLCDKAGIRCKSAAVDYAKGLCLKLDRNSQGRSRELKRIVGKAYVEKVCLQMPVPRCSGSQGTVAFIRVPGIELASYAKHLQLVQSRQECQQKCVEESSFRCKSALYDEAAAVCKLSPDSIHSLPPSSQVSRSSDDRTSHMENTCNYDGSFAAACRTQKHAGRRLIYADSVTSGVQPASACEALCRQSPTCRSFGYGLTSHECSLSAVSSRIPDVQLTVPSTAHDYYEFECGDLTPTPLPMTGGTQSTDQAGTASVSGGDPPTSDSSFRTNMSTTLPDTVVTPQSQSPTTEPITVAFTVTDPPTVAPASVTATTRELVNPLTTPSPPSATATEPLSTLGSTDVASVATTVTTPTSVTEGPPSPTLFTLPSETTTETATTQTAVGTSQKPTTQTRTVAPSTEPQISGSSMPTRPSPSVAVTESTTVTSSAKVDQSTATLAMTTTTATTIKSGTSDSNPSSVSERQETAVSNTNTVPMTASASVQTASTTASTSSLSTSTNNVTPTDSAAHTSRQAPTDAPPTRVTASPSLVTTAPATKPATPTHPSGEARALACVDVFSPDSHVLPPSPCTGSTWVCPRNHVSTFERMPGFEPIGNYFFALLCGSDPNDPGIVQQCSLLCSERDKCVGFVLDYQTYLCYGLISDSSSQHLSLCMAEEKDFYKRICIPSSLSCGKLFTFDRILDQEVEFNSIIPRYTIPFISKDACKCLCLDEKKFTCRTMSYAVRGSVCRIYDQSRTSITLSFSRGSEVFDNACASDSGACSYIRPEMDVGPVSVIKSLSVRSLYECKWACDSTLAFNCRSFNFVDRIFTGATSNLCLLYSDNQMTARKGSLKRVPRSLFYQKVCT